MSSRAPETAKCPGGIREAQTCAGSLARNSSETVFLFLLRFLPRLLPLPSKPCEAKAQQDKADGRDTERRQSQRTPPVTKNSASHTEHGQPVTQNTASHTEQCLGQSFFRRFKGSQKRPKRVQRCTQDRPRTFYVLPQMHPRGPNYSQERLKTAPQAHGGGVARQPSSSAIDEG